VRLAPETGLQRLRRKSTSEAARDHEIGQRGEALAYRQALSNAKKLGHANPAEAVVWTSQTNPGADHDIRMMGPDGKTIWIEVKATTGVDGRFHWPKNEFQKALREGERYELWRVYEADTDHATIKIFRNPAAMIQDARLQLDLGTLRASVEPKGATLARVPIAMAVAPRAGRPQPLSCRRARTNPRSVAMKRSSIGPTSLAGSIGASPPRILP
jgi:hypothetical protein